MMAGAEGATTATPVCGVGGFTTCSEADLQVCDPIKQGERWYGRSRLFMRDNKDTKESEPVFVGKGEKIPEGVRQLREDNPKTKDVNESEWQGVISNGWLEQYGYRIMCRSENWPYRHFVAKAQSLAEYLANFNEKPDGAVRSPFDIALYPAEVQALASYPPLALSEDDVAIKPGYTPEDTAAGTAIYHFTKDPNRLGQIIAVLENTTDQLAIAPERRAWFVTQLKQLTKPSDLQLTNLEKSPDQWWKSVLGQIGGSTPFQLAFMYILLKQMRYTAESLTYMRQQMEGNMPKNRLENFTRDYIQETREKLAEDIYANETYGRDEEAIEFLKRLTRKRGATPLVLAESGVGKDEVIKRAIQLIVLRDPRVPDEFFDGRIKGFRLVDPSAYNADTSGRGDSGARNREMENAQKKGEVVYFPELSDHVTAGVADGTTSESLASSLKTALMEGWAKFAGTTTPRTFQDLVRKHGWLRDLERRLPPLVIGDYHVDELREIIPHTLVPRYEDHYNVEIEPAAAEAAVNLGLKYYLPDQSRARYDAIDRLLMETIERKKPNRVDSTTVTITAEDVAETVRLNTGNPTISATEQFQDTVPQKVRREHNVSYTKQFQRQLQVADPWFAGLSEREQRALVRKAVSWQLMPEEAPRGVVDRGGRLNPVEAMKELREIHAREEVRRSVEADPRFQGLLPERRIAIKDYIEERLGNRGDATRLLQDADFLRAPAEHVWQRVESSALASASSTAAAAAALRVASSAPRPGIWARAREGWREGFRVFRGK